MGPSLFGRAAAGDRSARFWHAGPLVALAACAPDAGGPLAEPRPLAAEMVAPLHPGPSEAVAVWQAAAAPAAVPTQSEVIERLHAASARSGDLQFSLAWSSGVDLDLHVRPPCGSDVSFMRRRACGADLDIDANALGAKTTRPVENIYLPTGGAAPGTYKVSVVYFARHDLPIGPVPFAVKVRVAGADRWFHGELTAVGQVREVAVIGWPPP